MYLRHKPTGDLVEVLDLVSLVDPFRNLFEGRFHAGEELQDPAWFDKADLVFPSGEPLPRAWTDPAFRVRLLAECGHPAHAEALNLDAGRPDDAGAQGVDNRDS